jgi:hypothetical protein
MFMLRIIQKQIQYAGLLIVEEYGTYSYHTAERLFISVMQIKLLKVDSVV